MKLYFDLPGTILYEAIKAISPPDRAGAVAAVREYWNHPLNVSERGRTLPKELCPNGTVKSLAWVLKNPDHEDYDNLWRGLVHYARSDKQGLELLKSVASRVVRESERDLPPRARGVIAAILADEFQPPSRKGRRELPRDVATNEQLAEAAQTLHKASEKLYSLTSIDTNSTNAFSIVSEATGKPFDVVRHATRAYKKNMREMFRKFRAADDQWGQDNDS